MSAPSVEGDARLARYLMIGLTAATMAAFFPMLGGPFLNWDDWLLVSQNVDLLPESWPSILTYWDPRHPHLELYTPLTYSVYFGLSWLGHATGGVMDPRLFHAANLACHLAGGWCVWRLLARLTDRPIAAAIGAGVFLLHPIQVEAVSWISSLSTVLGGSLAAAALLLFVRAGDASNRVRANLWFAGSCALFLLAMLAKPSVIGLPLAAFAIDRLILRRPWHETFSRVVAWALLALPIVIAGRFAQPAMRQTSSWSIRPIVVLDSAGHYLAKLVVPYPLAIDYSRTPAFVAALPASTIVYAAVAIAVGFVCLWQRRARPWIAAGALVAIAGVAPVLGFVPFAFQEYSSVADRYAYLSLIGVAIVAAFALRGARRGDRRFVPACAALVALGMGTHLASYAWQSDDALFGQTLASFPNSRPANATWAFALSQRVDRTSRGPARDALFARATRLYEHVLKVDPKHSPAHFNYGNMLLRAGNAADAIPHYAAVDPSEVDRPRLNLNWGIALVQVGQIDEGNRRLRRAALMLPDRAEAHANLGAALARRGDVAEARTAFQRALAIDPEQPQAKAGLAALDKR